MKKLIIAALAMAAFLITGTVNAALFTIELEGLPTPSSIETLNVEFLVSSDFTYTANSFQFGDAVPYVPSDHSELLPWTFSPPKLAHGVFTIDVFNGDSFDGILPLGNKDNQYEENNLLNGILATFEYAGQIEGVNYFFAANSIGMAIDYPLYTDFHQEDGVLILSAVPIPATAILFLSGIFGLVGIRRFKGGQRES